MQRRLRVGGRRLRIGEMRTPKDKLVGWYEIDAVVECVRRCYVVRVESIDFFCNKFRVDEPAEGKAD